jgi:hypothetical protein
MRRTVFLITLAWCLFGPNNARADFLGVTLSHQSYSIGLRPVAYDLVDIDLTAPGIRLQMTTPDSSGKTYLQTTRDYVTQVGAQVGINASFFAPTSDVSGTPVTAIGGLAASNGNIYSPWSSAWPALNIAADNTVTFLDSQPAAGSVYNGVAGTYRLLRGGNLVNNSYDSTLPDARTAVGLTANHHLLLLVVDGRNLGLSLGLTYVEEAQLLQSLGAIDAINLDGGDSSTLVVADPTPHVFNVPVGIGGVPGTERPVGTNLVVFAQSVPEPRSVVLLLLGIPMLAITLRTGLRTRNGA